MGNHKVAYSHTYQSFMELIDAYWENPNTGKHTCEIIFEPGEDSGSYPAEIVNNQYEFSVAKVPAGNLRLIHFLETEGYRYLENQFVIEFDVSQLNSLNNKWKSRTEGFSCDLITDENGIETVFREVGMNMFDTDRYSLDPYWGRDVSSRRYCNWLRSLYEQSTTSIYLMKRDADYVGFFTLKKETETLSNCPIAGIFNRYKTKGYFFALTYLWLHISSDLGYRKLTTSISSNNIPIHSFLARVFSFKIEKTYVVLRRIVNNK